MQRIVPVNGVSAHESDRAAKDTSGDQEGCVRQSWQTRQERRQRRSHRKVDTKQESAGCEKGLSEARQSNQECGQQGRFLKEGTAK